MPLRPDTLPYRKPEVSKHYWIKDNILPNPFEVAERCFNKPSWTLGSPLRREAWPGIRAPEALRSQQDPVGGVSGHNYVQIVAGDAVARPHVDSSRLCDYAGVLYMHPYPPTKHAGTSFFRLKLPDGTLGGNICPPSYESLSQVPGLEKGSDLTMWEEDIEVPNAFNRLLVYKSDIVHSATSYFGWQHDLGSQRIAVVFFWKTVPA